jgi:hypothetical protein
MKVVAADLPLFIVEMYTPGEIVEARRPFSAETTAEALLAAKGWITIAGTMRQTFASLIAMGP